MVRRYGLVVEVTAVVAICTRVIVYLCVAADSQPPSPGATAAPSWLVRAQAPRWCHQGSLWLSRLAYRADHRLHPPARPQGPLSGAKWEVRGAGERAANGAYCPAGEYDLAPCYANEAGWKLWCLRGSRCWVVSPSLGDIRGGYLGAYGPLRVPSGPWVTDPYGVGPAPQVVAVGALPADTITALLPETTSPRHAPHRSQ